MITKENGVLIGLIVLFYFLRACFFFHVKICAHNETRRDEFRRNDFISKLSRMTTSHLLGTVLQFYIGLKMGQWIIIRGLDGQ